ncbi:MAG TPA: hypothetical protein VHY30_09910 [Verrucomicrobiae bacterium]|jgi:hypothetical protein|nr:hypothetical protein [Verrucomicrobiae bacterium]
MLKILFTLDYEIHGNGEGNPHELMVEPTDRLLRLFDEYGAKLTIMADIAEILKFKEFAEQNGRDGYHYRAIVAQLQNAVRGGHDVQLHIHASYFNAQHDGKKWAQDWSEYDFAGLSLERLDEIVRLGKSELESLLQPVNPDYRCFVFRAANWSVNPGRNVIKALLNNGIKADTSIFKYGRRKGIVSFDYSAADSELVPWRVGEDDLCSRDDGGRLWEFPIYCENRWIGAFLSPNRLYRVAQSRQHRISENPSAPVANGLPTSAKNTGLLDKLSVMTKKHAWKADFNQCTGRQLIGALRRAEQRYSNGSDNLPFVLIGHSKLFNRVNEKSLRPFLEFVAGHNRRFEFGTFGAFANQLESPQAMVV